MEEAHEDTGNSIGGADDHGVPKKNPGGRNANEEDDSMDLGSINHEATAKIVSNEWFNR